MAGETHEYTDMYPGMAKTAREEGFPEVADWFETLAKAEKSHAGRFQKMLDPRQLAGPLAPRAADRPRPSARGAPRRPPHARRQDADTMSQTDKPVSYQPTDGLSYDPEEARYWDAAGLQKEVTRAFEVCHGCRMCFKYCDSFPILFDLIDKKHDGDVRKLTAPETDRVMDACFQCKLCEVQCPYTPARQARVPARLPEARAPLQGAAGEDARASRSATASSRTPTRPAPWPASASAWPTS